MKKILLLATLFTPLLSFGQSQIIASGNYDEMKLAYNPQTAMVTGYYESGTGDNGHGSPQFSCIFYLEGKVIGHKAVVKTYYPLDIFPKDNDDLIKGALTITSSNNFTVKLPEEHGGCWNVQHFKDAPVDFTLDGERKWLEVRYIRSAKSYFYNAEDEATKRKGYLLKGDVIEVDKIDGQWLHCFYNDKSQGWIKAADTNTPGK